MVKSYKRFYDEEGKIIRCDDTNHDVVVRFNRMIYPLLPKKSKTILDVGCGDGFLVKQLRKKGFDATGIDLSKTRISYARKKYGKHYKIGSIYDIKFKDKEFDTVIASEVIEHLENPDKAIRQLKRVSKKYIILTFPYKEKPTVDICPHCLKKFYRSGHIQYFDWKRINKIKKSHNLKIIKVKKVAYYPFINFPLPIAIFINKMLTILDKTTYVAILFEKLR